MTTQQAKEVLKDAGYFTDNLWNIIDVQSEFECDDETAQNILYWALTHDRVIEFINEYIVDVAENEQLERKS
jgi:hypothetical protein